MSFSRKSLSLSLSLTLFLQARKRQGSGLSLEQEGEYCLGSDDTFLKQLLSEGASSSSSGPVDPVFVNHEDSQHATHMDSLAFDGILSEDDMNEPRLDSICNSTVLRVVLSLEGISKTSE